MTEKLKNGSLTDWENKFNIIVETPEKAVKEIKPGWRVFVGTGCAEPHELVKAMSNRAGELSDVEVIHLLTLGEAPYAKKELSEHFKVNSFFVMKNVRSLIQEGIGRYTPIFMHDIPRLFSSGQLPLDLAFIQISPPDERGMCSMGVSVDVVKSAAENAMMVIAQVNPNMPRTFGDTLIDIYDIDILVPVDVPLLEVPSKDFTDETRKIGEHISALVESGSTIEFGIGTPQATMEFLKGKHDLGIHTEMLSDNIIDLIESGVVTGKRKTINKGKVVASFCLGTKKLFDYIDNNPIFSIRPTEYVNDPAIISKHEKMVAINTALEVDITGQVCADSVGPVVYSGFGGQVDFNRGAAASKGGKAIIALPSTAKNGKVSRIVSTLSPGSGVVTTRADVHYIVTEFGTAYLHGKSIQDRALALISIAHPDFRAELIQAAIEAKYLLPDMDAVKGKMFVEPPGLRATMMIGDSHQMKFRPIHPTDEPKMKDLFYKLSEGTIYYRFGTHLKKLPQKQIKDFVYIDHRNQVSIVGTVPRADGDEIVALGCYYLDSKTNRAEVALVTSDNWQNKGIGTYLIRYLATIARRNGIRGFTAQIHSKNRSMQIVMNKLVGKAESSLDNGQLSILVDFK